MKYLMMALLSIASVNAFAGADDGMDASSGLSCTMTYKKSSPFSAYQISETSWLDHGSSLKGPAASEESSLEGGAHSIVVYKETMNRGQDGWLVRISDKTGADLGRVTFAQDKAMNISFPVEVWDTGQEAPDKFDVLEVSCFHTIFAG